MNNIDASGSRREAISQNLCAEEGYRETTQPDPKEAISFIRTS